MGLKSSFRGLPLKQPSGWLALLLLTLSLMQLRAQSGIDISIMPLGDSLTWGFDATGLTSTTPQYNSDYQEEGGYRSPLYQALTAQGIGVTYVGADNGNPSPTLIAAGETAQDGFNDYRIDQLEANLTADVPPTGSAAAISNDGGYWLTNYAQPNIILLQAGANDIEQGYDPLFTGTPGTETPDQLAADTASRLIGLINQIRIYDPKALILTDGTPYIIYPIPVASASSDYEADVKALVKADYLPSQVDYVDMDAALAPGSFSAYTGDGLHLTALGYQLMADGQEEPPGGYTAQSLADSPLAGWDAAIISDYVDELPVPEPSTYALFISGGVLLFAWRKFRQA